jgi:hypothetical protein
MTEWSNELRALAIENGVMSPEENLAKVFSGKFPELPAAEVHEVVAGELEYQNEFMDAPVPHHIPVEYLAAARIALELSEEQTKRMMWAYHRDGVAVLEQMRRNR